MTVSISCSPPFPTAGESVTLIGASTAAGESEGIADAQAAWGFRAA